MKKILVAMSGGIDSSCAAFLLKREGYEVSGAFMNLWKPSGGSTQSSLKHQALYAQRVARHLDIPFHSFNFQEEFLRCVIDYFKTEYENGRTPNPCAVCNQKIKFDLFLKKALEVGMDGIATGHYIISTYDKEKDAFLLKEGKDKRKDQSYFLFLLYQHQLSHSIFPLGGYRKDDVKKIVQDKHLPTEQGRESQEICFIDDDNYVRFLADECGIKSKDGIIKDTGGRVLGKHNGYFNYTVGQRRGLGIGAPQPLYVVAVDSNNNEVIVGKREETLRKKFDVQSLHWIASDKGEASFKTKVRVRYNQDKLDALVEVKTNSCTVQLQGEGDVITPGQAAVFYEGETVLGGGWIV